MKKQIRITLDSKSLDYLVTLQGETITEKLNNLLTTMMEKQQNDGTIKKH